MCDVKFRSEAPRVLDAVDDHIGWLSILNARTATAMRTRTQWA